MIYKKIKNTSRSFDYICTILSFYIYLSIKSKCVLHKNFSSKISQYKLSKATGKVLVTQPSFGHLSIIQKLSKLKYSNRYATFSWCILQWSDSIVRPRLLVLN